PGSRRLALSPLSGVPFAELCEKAAHTTRRFLRLPSTLGATDLGCNDPTSFPAAIASLFPNCPSLACRNSGAPSPGAARARDDAAIRGAAMSCPHAAHQ